MKASVRHLIQSSDRVLRGGVLLWYCEKKIAVPRERERIRSPTSCERASASAYSPLLAHSRATFGRRKRAISKSGILFCRDHALFVIIRDFSPFLRSFGAQRRPRGAITRPGFLTVNCAIARRLIRADSSRLVFFLSLKSHFLSSVENSESGRDDKMKKRVFTMGARDASVSLAGMFIYIIYWLNFTFFQHT